MVKKSFKKTHKKRFHKKKNWAVSRMVPETRITKNFPFPRYFKTKMRYCDYGAALNPGVAGVAANYFYSCNGLYDPNITGGGHQPIGFDQLSAMYNHYCVIGSKITAMFRSADGTYYHQVGIRVNPDTTTNVDFTNIVENGDGVYGYVGTAGNGGKSEVTLTLPWSAKRYFGGRRGILHDDNLCGGAGASNPSEQSYFMCWAQPDTGNDSTGVILSSVVIEYIVIWIEPKATASS